MTERAQPREFSLQDLAEETGVPARTIRFYISKGLVPGPVRAGRGAVYSSEHLNVIERIKQLQNRGLTLNEAAFELTGRRGASVLPDPSPWLQFSIAKDVTVWVRADASPWRHKQIRAALAEAAERLRAQAPDR